MIRLAPLALVLAAGLPAAAQPETALPITGITLYRSGVGAFERQGLIQDDGDVQLRFAADQINDILKSMFLLDLDGGHIDAVGYASREPLSRRLASFGIDISDNPDLATLFGRIRGTPVRVATIDGDITGTILGVEKRPELGLRGESVLMKPHLNLLTDSGMTAIDITEVSRFELLDEDLKNELGKALKALAEHQADRTKTVDISLSGEGARRVVVGYVHEMPVWKTSYRLVLPGGAEAASNGGEALEGQPTIQGWAIVENTTDEDWEDVRLSLVAGQPVSFRMDLYEPLHVYRPEVPVPTVAGARPRVYEGAVREQSEYSLMSPNADGARGRDRSARQMPTEAGRSAMNFPEVSADAMTQYAAKAQASGADVGEVFQFALDMPVTIERQRSAMIPIISAPIEGERVSIYNARELAKHPMRGIKLTNSSEIQLMPGPISVFDGAAYAGDAQIGHVSVGDSRLLAYAVDLDVEAMTDRSGTTTVQRLRIIDGYLETLRIQEQTVTHTLLNKDRRRARTILVEHPKSQGWALETPSKADEETDSLYRFRVETEPGRSASITITERRLEGHRQTVTDADLPSLLAYAADGKASQKVVEAVREAARLSAQVAETRRALSKLEEESDAIARDQSRIRENMARLDQSSQLYAQYIRKLTDQEARLESISSERKTLQAQLVTRETALREYIRDLEVD